MDAIENSGRLSNSIYSKCTIYSTLSPCDMCSGTCILYGINRIVIGENVSFKGPEEYLKSKKNLELINLNNQTCINLMNEFMEKVCSVYLFIFIYKYFYITNYIYKET